MSFPPITASAEGKAPTLVIVTAPHYIYDACWAAYSLLLNLPSPVQLHIVVDGWIEDEQIVAVNRLFNGGKLSKGADFIEQIPQQYPNLLSLCNKHPLGTKLASLLVIQEEHDVIYSDSDVLGFGCMPEFELMTLNNGPNLYLNDNYHMVEPILVKHAEAQGVTPCQNLNSGVMFVKRNSLSLDLAECIIGDSLKDTDFDMTSWFVEQTIISLLMGATDAKALPSERYVVNTKGQWYFDKDLNYDDIALRHFVSPIRFLMFQKGMPLLYKRLKNKN